MTESAPTDSPTVEIGKLLVEAKIASGFEDYAVAGYTNGLLARLVEAIEFLAPAVKHMDPPEHTHSPDTGRWAGCRRCALEEKMRNG